MTRSKAYAAFSLEKATIEVFFPRSFEGQFMNNISPEKLALKKPKNSVQNCWKILK